jgi:hypothetical protein
MQPASATTRRLNGARPPGRTHHSRVAGLAYLRAPSRVPALNRRTQLPSTPGRHLDARPCATAPSRVGTVKPVTDRSGTGPIDLAILQATDTPTTRRSGRYITCSKLLPRIEAAIGLGPRYAYDALLDLARPWVINVPAITTQGNAGDRDFPATEPWHLQCRPSRTGQAILDAEAGRAAPVPAGLINGTAYRGGTQPPLDPDRAIAALRYLLEHPRAAVRDILAIAGPPRSVTDCIITGDLDALAAGRPVTLRQTGRITRTSCPVPATVPDPIPSRVPPDLAAKIAAVPGDTRPRSVAWFSSGPDERRLARAHLIIESLPPGISPSEVHQELASEADQHIRAAREERQSSALPIGEIIDASTSEIPIRLAIVLRPGTDPDTARDQLAAFDGITTQSPAAYPAPLAALLRAWTRQHHHEDTPAALTSLTAAIHCDREQRSD